MNWARLIRGFSVLVAIATCWIVVNSAMHQSIDFNSSLDLTVAKSLGQSFSYRMSYSPSPIYPVQVSANGPVQYFGGLGYAITHSIDGAVVASVLASMGLLLVGLMLFRNWFSALGLLLLYVFPQYAALATQFNGYIWAAAAILVAIALLERCRPPLDLRSALRDPRFWVACLLFSTAIAAKTLYAFAAFTIVFGAMYYQGVPDTRRAVFRNVVRAVVLSFVAAIASTVLFFAEVSVSVAHTTRSLGGLFEGPAYAWNFVNANVHGGADILANHVDLLTRLSQYNNSFTLWLVLVCAIAMVARRPAYGVFVAAAAFFYLYVGMMPHQVSGFFLIIIVLGVRDILEFARALARRAGKSGALGEISFASLLIVVLATTATRVNAMPPADPGRLHAVRAGIAEVYYSRALIDILRSSPYVLTSGYWQFPEISNREDLHFYNRIAPQNASLWNKNPVLLFDTSNSSFPETTKAANCGATIYVDGPLMVCHARPDVPLNYVEDTRMAEWTAPAATRDLSKATWTLSPGVRRVVKAQSISYAIDGGVALIANDAVSLGVDVRPGETYVFSAQVDPTAITGGPNGQFNLSISSADGKSSFASAFYPGGPPTRYATRLWTCPPTVHSVRLMMQVISTTIAPGKALTFSAPRLSRYSASTRRVPKP